MCKQNVATENCFGGGGEYVTLGEVSKISHQYMKILISNDSQPTREISKKEENFEG